MGEFKSEAVKFGSAVDHTLNAKNSVANAIYYLENSGIYSEDNKAGNFDFTKFIGYIYSANDKLKKYYTDIQDVKADLIKTDRTFAENYAAYVQEKMNHISNLDPNNMTEQDMVDYNNFKREYDYYLLAMLEQYVGTDQMTEEMQEVYENQLKVIKQYELQDELSILPVDSQRYVDKYKQIIDISRETYEFSLTHSDPPPSQEELEAALKYYDESYGKQFDLLQLNSQISKKTKALSKLKAGSDEFNIAQKELYDLQISYLQKQGNLNEQQQAQLKQLSAYSELYQMFIDGKDAKDDDVIAFKVKNGIATEAEIEYNSMSDWDKFWAGTATFLGSIGTGLCNIGENFIDCGAMLLGKVGVIDKQAAEDFVRIDFSGEAYDSMMKNTNAVIAYGGWHTAGNIIGSIVGNAALSFLPGGPFVTGLAMGVNTMGEASERAIQSGASFDGAFKVGLIEGGVGFVSGLALGHFGDLAAGANSWGQVAAYTACGMASSAAEPIINSVVEYEIYAKNMTDENGNKLYEDYGDYYVKGGGLTGTIIATIAGGVSTAVKGVIGYKKSHPKLSSKAADAPDTEVKLAVDGDDIPDVDEPKVSSTLDASPDADVKPTAVVDDASDLGTPKTKPISEQMDDLKNACSTQAQTSQSKFKKSVTPDDLYDRAARFVDDYIDTNKPIIEAESYRDAAKSMLIQYRQAEIMTELMKDPKLSGIDDLPTQLRNYMRGGKVDAKVLKVVDDYFSSILDKYTTFNGDWMVTGFDPDGFAKDYSSIFNVPNAEINTRMAASTANNPAILDDLRQSAIQRITEDFQLGVKDPEAYLEMLFSDKDAWAKDFRVKGFDATVNPGKDNYTFYQYYTEEILGQDYVQSRMDEFFHGQPEAKVYCIQNEKNFGIYTANGGLGRPGEGFNAFSADSMIRILDEATPDDVHITTISQVDDILSGKTTVDIDYDKLKTSLDLPDNYLDNGGAIVSTIVTPDDVRATMFIDGAANSRFLSGMHTAHMGEIMVRDFSGFTLDMLGEGNKYFSTSGTGVQISGMRLFPKK